MPSKVCGCTAQVSPSPDSTHSPSSSEKEEVCLAEVSAQQRQYTKKAVPVSSDIYVGCPKFEIVLEGGIDISVVKAVIAEVDWVC